MSRAIVIALAAAFAASGSAQPPVAPPPRPAVGEVSLLVVEAVPDKDEEGKPYRLLRVRFKAGVMQTSECVWEGDWEFLVEYWRPRLIDNQFLVTRCGGVIDIAARKVIHPELKGELVLARVQGKKVIYRSDEEAREQGIFAFDLTTRRVEKLSKLDDRGYDWAELFPERISPDGRRWVVGDRDSALSVYEAGKNDPRSLGKGFSAFGSWPRPTGPVAAPLPVLWLDNDRLLTQLRNGELVVVKLDGSRTPIARIPAREAIEDPCPSLTRDGGGRVIYQCNRKWYVIDVDAGKFTPTEWEDLGHGFDRRLSWDDSSGQLRYKEEVIRPHSSGKVFATDGYLAVMPDPTATVDDEDGTIQIWSPSTREWSKLPLRRASAIGWMK